MLTFMYAVITYSFYKDYSVIIVGIGAYILLNNKIIIVI